MKGYKAFDKTYNAKECNINNLKRRERNMKKLKLTLSFEFPESHFVDLVEIEGLTLEEAVQQSLEDGNIELIDYLVSQTESEVVNE